MKSIILVALLLGVSISIRISEQPTGAAGRAGAAMAPSGMANATGARAGMASSGMMASGMSNATGVAGVRASATNNTFPMTFWTNIDGKPGNDFIALKSLNNTLIRCDAKGKLFADNKPFKKDALWTVIMNTNLPNYFAFRSYYGGYLSFTNNTFSCDSRIQSEGDFFELIRNFGNLQLPNNINTQDAIALKFNNGYLGLNKNNLVLLKNLNQDAIFQGLNKASEVTLLQNKQLHMERVSFPARGTLTGAPGEFSRTGMGMTSGAAGGMTGGAAAGAMPSAGGMAGAGRAGGMPMAGGASGTSASSGMMTGASGNR